MWIYCIRNRRVGWNGVYPDLPYLFNLLRSLAQKENRTESAGAAPCIRVLGNAVSRRKGLGGIVFPSMLPSPLLFRRGE